MEFEQQSQREELNDEEALSEDALSAAVENEDLLNVQQDLLSEQESIIDARQQNQAGRGQFTLGQGSGGLLLGGL